MFFSPPNKKLYFLISQIKKKMLVLVTLPKFETKNAKIYLGREIRKNIFKFKD